MFSIEIVGYYLDRMGNEHGFLATPVPEPSTLMLLAVGTLGLIAWVWWRRGSAGSAVEDMDIIS